MRYTTRVVVGLAAAGALTLSVAGTATAEVSPAEGTRSKVAAAPAKVDPIIAAAAIANRYMKAPTGITQTIPLRVPAPQGKFVIMIQNGLAGTVLQQSGLEAAAKELKWKFQAVNYNPANPADLQKAMLNALALKPDAIVTAGANPDLYGASVLAAYGDAGVPIIVNSQCPLFAKPPLFKGAALCAGEDTAGKAFANWFIADSKGKGKALFQNLPSIPALSAFVNAFRSEVSNKCPGCVVDVFETTLAQIGANQLIPGLVNKLRSDPTYGYVFLDNAQWGSTALSSALEAAGLGNVKVGGRSADANAIAALQQGKQAAWTAFPYPLVGAAAMDSVLRVLTKSSGIDKNSIPPMQILTPANAKAVATPYNLPANGLQQFMRIWKR